MSSSNSGGAKTKTGAKFESRIWDRLKSQIKSSAENILFEEGSGLNFLMSDSVANSKKRGRIFVDGELLGFMCSQDDLYNFLAENYPTVARTKTETENRKRLIKSILSKNLNPDMAFVNLQSKKLVIVEIKAQNKDGSVDEKLETVDFKRKQYAKLVEKTDIETVEFKWILDKRFEHAKYSDVKGYIKEMNSDFLIDEINPEFVGIL
jgi:flagellar biosynthesis regulator FlaF